MAEVGQIEAPFSLRSKFLELHLRSSGESSRDVDVHLRNLSADLNFRARVFLAGRRHSFIRSRSKVSRLRSRQPKAKAVQCRWIGGNSPASCRQIFVSIRPTSGWQRRTQP